MAKGAGGRDWRRTNCAMWDERVSAHAASALYDLDRVVAGRDDLRPWEDDELGKIDGLEVIHLQRHIGTDTVALARRGARTVGLDFSQPALTVAAGLAERCGLEIDGTVASAGRGARRRRGEARVSVQIARASSSNAAGTVRPGSASTPSS